MPVRVICSFCKKIMTPSDGDKTGPILYDLETCDLKHQYGHMYFTCPRCADMLKNKKVTVLKNIIFVTEHLADRYSRMKREKAEYRDRVFTLDAKWIKGKYTYIVETWNTPYAWAAADLLLGDDYEVPPSEYF